MHIKQSGLEVGAGEKERDDGESNGVERKR